jgi:tetratricopeptide (TPR) repeat protein
MPGLYFAGISDLYRDLDVVSGAQSGVVSRNLVFFGLAMLSLGQTPGLEGDWQGTLVLDQARVRLVLHIARAADGRFFGQMDRVDQGATTLIDSIQLTGDSVRLEFKAINGVFQGTLNLARTGIKGSWIQGAPVPLDFTRIEQPKPTSPAGDTAAVLARNKALNDAFNAGRAALGAKDYAGAIENLEKASVLGPTQHVVWGNLGDAYTGLASLEKAADAYKRAIELKPNEAGYHNNYARVLDRLKKPSEAQAEFLKAAEIDPAHAGQYYFNVGAAFVNAQQMDQAVTAFRRAIEADATNAEAYFQLGMCLFTKKTGGKPVWPDGTQQAFEKYLALKPDGPNAGVAKAKLQEMKGVTVVGTPVMSKITGSPCPSDAPPAATQFLSTDSVTLWFRLAGLSADDTLTIRHTEPNGEVTRIYSGIHKLKAGTWPFCLIKNNPATMPVGAWSIGAYLNQESTPLFPPLTFTLQRAIVPPPAPLGEGASLEATRKYIQDGLNSPGRMEYTGSAPGRSFDEVTGAITTSARCELSFHALSGIAGAGFDHLITLSFVDVENLSVAPQDTQPPNFGLTLKMKGKTVVKQFVSPLKLDPATNALLAAERLQTVADKKEDTVFIRFREEEPAQRMAAAMVHAVELCGGGN